jgi:hypothetical protein
VSSRYTRWLAVPRRILRLRLSPTGHVSLGGDEKKSPCLPPRQNTDLNSIQYHGSWVPLCMGEAEIQGFSQPAYEVFFLITMVISSSAACQNTGLRPVNLVAIVYGLGRGSRIFSPCVRRSFLKHNSGGCHTPRVKLFFNIYNILLLL